MKQVAALLVLVAAGLVIFLVLATPLVRDDTPGKVTVPNAGAIQRKYVALNLAERYWGDTKCVQEEIPIFYRPMTYSILARAHYVLYGDGSYRQCWIVVNSNRSLDWVRFCGTIIHEYGHLKGKGHSTNPYAIMYPKLTAKNIPRICLTTQPGGNV